MKKALFCKYMWKWTIALIGCMLLLQGCVPTNNNEPIKQEMEREIMSEGLDEQLLQIAERGDRDTLSKLIKEAMHRTQKDKLPL